MTAYSLAVGMFAADIGMIGLLSLTQIEDMWAPVGFGMLGVALVFGGSVALIAEAHLALVTIHREMIHLSQLGHRHLLTVPVGLAASGRSSGIKGREGDRAAGEVGHVSNAGQVMGTPDVNH
jgi:hypothetical protein